MDSKIKIQWSLIFRDSGTHNSGVVVIHLMAVQVFMEHLYAFFRERYDAVFLNGNIQRPCLVIVIEMDGLDLPNWICT